MDIVRLTLLTTGAAMVLIGGVLLAAAPGKLLHRLFAALLAARGLTMLLPHVSGDPAWVEAAVRFQPFVVVPILPLAIGCWLLLAPRPSARGIGWWTLGIAAFLWTAYAVQPTSFQSLATGAPAHPALGAAPGIAYTDFGPLGALASAGNLALGLVGLRALLVYRIAAAHGQGNLTRIHLLAGAGLVIGALFDGTSRLVALADLLDQSSGYPWFAWGWAPAIVPATALAPGILGLAVLGAILRDAQSHERGVARTLVVLALIAPVAGLSRILMAADPNPAGATAITIFLGLSRLVMPALVAWGLLSAAVNARGSDAREAVVAASGHPLPAK